MLAVGLVETKGLIVLVAATDAMLKAANVQVVKQIRIGGGLVTAIVSGDVGSVRISHTLLDPELTDLIAREAAAWKFKAMHVDGQPLSGQVSVKVHYELNAGETASVPPIAPAGG